MIRVNSISEAIVTGVRIRTVRITLNVTVAKTSIVTSAVSIMLSTEYSNRFAVVEGAPSHSQPAPRQLHVGAGGLE